MPDSELEIAFQKHSAGNLAEAEAGYRRYLKDNPNSAPGAALPRRPRRPAGQQPRGD